MVLESILAVAVCLTLIILALLPPRPGVTKANFDRIGEGMTLEQVNAILGPHPDVDITLEPLDTPEHKVHEFRLRWYGSDGVIHVDFGADSICIGKHWNDSPRTLSEIVRQWLHLQ